MDVDSALRKLNFNEYSETPKKKPRPQTEQPETTHLEVFLRIRPSSKITTAEYTLSNENKSIRLSSPNQSDTRNYSFDYIFNQDTSNTQVFTRIGAIAIDRFLNGYSNLIFSYGITGSGKTHTIMGSNNQLDGLIPLILTQLFNNNKNGKYNIFASYLENYNKEIYDLLIENNDNTPLNMRVLPTGIDIPDLKTIQITNTKQALELIAFGNNKRKQAHTKLNTNSSRSHALFILDLFNTSNNKLISQLCIVDLAGSESVKRTGFNPNDKRFVESCEINSSLSVLNRCIECIKDGSNNVPWREVILTKILYQYLTGNGYVNMIVNAHISNDGYNETIRAIEFGSNSQNITMNPIVNSVRMSTRHKSRICNDKNNVGHFGINMNHINCLSSLKNIKQLQQVAIASYTTVFKMKYIIYKLRDDKISQLDRFIKYKENERKMQSIEEENEYENNDIDNDKYKRLSQEMAAKEMAFEEKMAEINHLYGQLSGKNEMIEKYKNELLDRDVKINKYKMDVNEIETLKNECNKYKQLLDTVNNNMNNMKNEMCKYNEKENELNGLKNKLETDVNRYKIVMDENEQKIERLGHKIRDFKQKLQTKCIEISEKDEILCKLKNEMNKLKEEYIEKSNTFKKINDDAREEIINLINKCDELKNIIIGKDNEINELNKYGLDINKQMDMKNEEIENLKQYNNEIIDENKNKLNELNKCINDKQQQIIDLKKHNNEMETELSGKDKKIEELLDKDIEIDIKNTEINNMKNEINELKNIINDLYNKNDEKDSLLNKYKVEMDTQMNIKNEEINKLKNELKCEKENNNEMKEMNGKNDELLELNNEIEDMRDKLNGVTNDKNQIIRELNNIINDKNQLIENEKYILNEKNELMIKLNNCMNEKNNQSNKLMSLSENINKLNNELNINKININKEIEQIKNEFNNKIIIKCSEFDTINSELRNKYTNLETQLNKEKEYNKISLAEADEQYMLAQKEITELNSLNCEFEKQKNEKIELEKQLNILQKQLNNLRLKSLPLYSAPHSAPHSTQNNTPNVSNKISRKRLRNEMENNINNNINNPNKKRKITIENNCNNNDINIDYNTGNNDDINNGEENNDIIINNDNSLEPRKLINELMPITPPNNNNNNIKLSEINENIESLISPVPSHLSEGDKPLPKPNKMSCLNIGIIKQKQKQKQFKLMRTPITKSRFRNSDIINDTPITKTGLRKLRCVDLKQKLKKHSLKANGKKEDLVMTLFDHKNRNNNNYNSESSDDEIDYEWIGKYIKKCDNKIYYSGIKLNGIEFCINAECYINTEQGETWMSKIIELFEDENGDAFMGNMWYWKYNEIIKVVKNNNVIKNDNKLWTYENELFVSCGHKCDINSIEFIDTNKIFKVFNSKNEFDLYKKNNKNNKIDLYYVRYSFNTKTKMLIENENNKENIDNNMKNKKPKARNRRKKKIT